MRLAGALFMVVKSVKKVMPFNGKKRNFAPLCQYGGRGGVKSRVR